MGYKVKEVRAAANGRWPDILAAFGVDRKALRDEHGPCPACGGNDRFRFDDKNGDGDWYCNQCGGPNGDGGAGDGFMLLQRVCSLELGDAINEVGKFLYLPDPENDNRPRAQTMPRNEKPAGASDAWVPMIPVPADAPPLVSGGVAMVWNPKKEGAEGYSGSKLRPAHVAEVRNIEGDLFGYVLRCEFKPGEKITPQVTYCAHRETGELRWCMIGIPPKRPLVGSELLADVADGGSVMVVEGEKKREAALRLVGGRMPVVSWIGGAKAVGLTDWTGLRGLKVIGWPDADPEGIAAMNGTSIDGNPDRDGVFQAVIAAGAAGFRWVAPPAEHLEAADGWDLDDAEAEGWDWGRLAAYIRDNIREAAPVDRQTPKAAAPEGKPTPAPIAAPAPAGAVAGPVPAANDNEPDDPNEEPEVGGGIASFVRPMGHNGGSFYYWSAGLGQIVEMAPGKHTKSGLMALAGADIWRAFFPKPKSTEFDTDAAADWMMESCRLLGVYDPRKVRGRGAWIDDERSILHLGDRLIVDGRPTDLPKLRSVYAYQANYRLRGPADTPITRAEIRQLEDLANRIRWDVPASAYLLLGWVTLAPICGALKQRPSIWITGASGSGKTTVLQKFLIPLLGDLLHYFQGAGTTEPGIRQELAGDAIPVVVDEFEQNDKRHQERVQAILELARGSYSDDGAKTAKGSSGGTANLYTVRSMFAFSSINVGIKEKADTNRIAVLSVRNPEEPETDADRERLAADWENFAAALDFITPELGRRILARTVSRLPMIRENVRVFVRAAAGILDSQRLADTYGVMMGGAWSLLHDAAATPQSAKAMLKALDWSVYTESAAENEAESVLSAMLQHVVLCDGADTRASLSLGELVKISATGHGFAGIYREDADAMLARYGLRVRAGRLFVANNSRLLARALTDTPYSINWKNYLRRIKGARSEGAIQFSTALTQRATSVPLDPIVPPEDLFE
ncbi:DUF6371 domain-containing protein [Pseudomonas phage ZRG1]|nr:DUF6371 domain-containing protein [Pseudomonas phage ZRG1]